MWSIKLEKHFKRLKKIYKLCTFKVNSLKWSSQNIKEFHFILIPQYVYKFKK